MKILFSNPPWWDVDLKTQQLLIGVRAGSRWPFTRYSVHTPGEFRHGGYPSSYTPLALPTLLRVYSLGVVVSV